MDVSVLQVVLFFVGKRNTCKKVYITIDGVVTFRSTCLSSGRSLSDRSSSPLLLLIYILI